MMNYIRKLESTSDIKIVPKMIDNPWNYEMFSKLHCLIMKKVNSDMVVNIGFGCKQAFM